MKDTFVHSFKLLLTHEGGFVNHPKDPGGMTNLGVTKKTWEIFKGHPVTETDIRALTPAVVEPLYKARYWDAIHGDDLPAGLDHCLFDTCVNSGPSQAVKLLQDALGMPMDGRIGPMTLGAIAHHATIPLISSYTTVRLAFLESLSTWKTFGEGWKTRVEAVEKEAKKLVVES
jgi:lysozyme family protein